MSAFMDVFLRSIDRGLGVLGDSVRSSIYYHLERRYKLSKHDLATKPDAFADAVEALFGAGAGTLLRLIVKELYVSVGLSPREYQNWAFSDYVAKAKGAFEEQSRL